MSMIDCPECEGEGTIYIEEGPASWMGSGVYVNEYPCRACDQTGKVVADTSDHLTEADLVPDALHHDDLQALIHYGVATVETFGMVTA